MGGDDSSPSALTLSGKSAPQMPGPSIGSIFTTPVPIFTSPDLRHAISASCRQASRSPPNCMNPRPQPASATSTEVPNRPNQTPRLMLAKMRGFSLTRHQHCRPPKALRIRNRFTRSPRPRIDFALSAHSVQALLRRGRLDAERHADLLNGRTLLVDFLAKLG